MDVGRVKLFGRGDDGAVRREQHRLRHAAEERLPGRTAIPPADDDAVRVDVRSHLENRLPAA